MARKPFAPVAVASREQAQSFFAERKPRSFRRWNLDGSSPSAAAIPAQPPQDPLVVAFENARAKGFEQGYAEGAELGRSEASAVSADLHSRLEASLREIETMREVLAEGYRRELVELGLGAAEALIGDHFPPGEPIVARLIEQGLEAIGGEEALVLEVSESDANAVSTWVGQRTPQTLEVTTDPALAEGDFRLRSPRGSIESVMAERIDRMRRLVLGEVDGGPAA